MQFETNLLGGWVIPSGTKISAGVNIPDWSCLGACCTLGDSCTIGDSCTLGAYCTLGDSCTLGANCTIGAYCTIGTSCTIGAYCSLGDNCTIGAYCTIGCGCRLGDDAQWMGVTVQSWLTLANVDGTGRQVKVVKHAEGVRVEAGCFQGTLEEFCTKAASEGKDRYVHVVSAVAAAM